MNFTDNQILKELKTKLAALLEEDRVAFIQQQKRDVLIKKTTLAIEAFSEGEPDVTDNTLNGAKKVDILEAFQNAVKMIPESNKLTENSFQYPHDKTWGDRIKAFLKYRGKAVTIAEITEAFKEYHPDYTEDRLNGAINNAVQGMFRKGLLKVYTPPIKQKGFFYANPLWFEGDTLKQEHVPDLKKNLTW